MLANMTIQVNSTLPAFMRELGCECPRCRSLDPWRIAHTTDTLFLEANTWHPHSETGHISFLEGIELIQLWRPKQAYVIHYSGHEGPFSGWRPKMRPFNFR